jgi:hypothetical protein
MRRGRHNSDPGGLGEAFRGLATVVGLGVAPVVALVVMYWTGIEADSLAVDFHHELYPQAKDLLSGENPYPRGDFEPLIGGNLVWPPLTVAVVAPLTVLPLGAADTLLALLGLACFAGALRLVGVTDWRVYGACALWPQVAGEMRVSHLTPVLALLLALTWRQRNRPVVPGLAVGVAIALKFFVWPFALWLASTRRWRAAALAAAIGLASLLSVAPFTGVGTYVSALLELGRHFDQDTYTVFGLLAQLGVGDVGARSVNVALGLGLLVATWHLRSFSMATCAALVLSPIVWLDYFALFAIPLAIVRPRLSLIWFLPLATWGADGTGLGIGDRLDITRVFLVFALVAAACARAERTARLESTATGRLSRAHIGQTPSTGEA